MAKNDFDFDMDFDEDLDFDSDAILDSDFDSDIDFSQFTDSPLEDDSADHSDDFDLDGLDLSDIDLDGIDLKDFSLDESADHADVDFGEENLRFSDAPAADEDYDGNVDSDAQAAYAPQEPEIIIPQGNYASAPQPVADENVDFDATDFDEEDFEQTVFGGPVRRMSTPAEDYPRTVPLDQTPVYQQVPPADVPAEQPAAPEEHENPQPPRTRRTSPDTPQREPRTPREHGPNVFGKLLKLYFPGKAEQTPAVDPNNPRRRRKRTKMQIFKEVYLPPILAGLTLVILLGLVIGSVSNAIQKKQNNDKQQEQQAQQQEQQADLLAQEAEQLLADAEKLALGYNYQAAIDLLDTFSGEAGSELAQSINSKKSEYMTTQSSLVEYKNYSDIANLSFHMLINDMSRALKDTNYGGMYNRNFVTTEEFSKILEQLYAGGYVLVDFDSFVGSSVGLDGNNTYYTVPITLPAGRKPIMLTQTQVNYYQFMVDTNKDGTIDCNAGFASRLVLDESGNIKAEYVDENGMTSVGNYDFVPILEAFIEAHPDFSYQGARATLAVSGSEGIFGYRINTSYISSVSQTYYDEQVAGAKALVAALREKGYNLACYTYADIPYGEKNANLIQADLQEWNKHIVPVIGNVDTIVFAKTSDIGDYSGPKFSVLYDCGFRFFLRHGSAPAAEVNNTYVRQTRLMVTGNAMQWQSSQFNSYFDAIAILDPVRGSVPN